MIVFAHPEAYYFLLAIPLLFALSVMLYRFRKNRLTYFGEQAKKFGVIKERNQIVFWSKVIAFILLWVCATVALSDPRGEGHYLSTGETEKNTKQFQRNPNEVILLIDASASMGVEDTPYERSRLEFSKEIADQIVSLLDGETVSLYAFTGQPVQLSPETYDYLFVRMMIDQLQINEGGYSGTDFYQVLKELNQKLLQQRQDQTQTVILISDGEDTSFQKEITSLLQEFPKERVQLFSIGVGSKEGGEIPGVLDRGSSVRSTLEERLLKELAEGGGGEYFEAYQHSPLTLAELIVQKVRKRQTVEKRKVASFTKEDLVYEYYFQYPLALAAMLLSFYILYPETGRFA